jgi:hypothetical protein
MRENVGSVIAALKERVRALENERDDLLALLVSIVIHEERGQGVLWREAMARARKIAEKAGPSFGWPGPGES